MIFGQDRQQLRQMYADAWRKFQAKEIMSSLEVQIAGVINDHPEYQTMLTPDALAASFTPEEGQTNPFLHMGLHLAIRDQLATDRPPGIAGLFKRLEQKSSDRHAAEHQFLDCLAEILWEAQGQSRPPDEIVYMERLGRL